MNFYGINRKNPKTEENLEEKMEWAGLCEIRTGFIAYIN
jgi:hypothetical protein